MTTDADPTLDLESRINARRAVLIEKLGRLKGDVRPQAIESRGTVKARLSDLAHLLHWGVAGDWKNVPVTVADKLEQWLTESSRQLLVRTEQA